MKPLPSLAGAALALAALACGAVPPARADVLRMENGRSMHGNVDRGFVDEGALRIQLYATGGTVRVRWEHLIPEDREKWQVDLGLKQSQEELQLKVDAFTFYFNGRTETLVGIVLNPEAWDGPATGEVRILSNGKVFPYTRGLLAKRDPIRADILQVYSPRQAYEIKRDEINPNNGDSHFSLAEYAVLVGAYDEAKEHFLKAKEDPAFADTGHGRQIETRLATLEILIKNASLRQRVVDLRNLLNRARAQAQFVKAAKDFLQATIEGWILSDAVPDPKVRKEFRIDEVTMLVATERRKFFEKKLPLEVIRRVRKMMEDKARESKARDFPPGLPPDQLEALKAQGTFEGARTYATRQVIEDLWKGLRDDVGPAKEIEDLKAKMEKDASKGDPADEALMKKMVKLEKDLPGELKAFWEGRDKQGQTMTTSYGYGTFIVTGTNLKLTRRTQGGGGQGGRGGNRGGGQQQPQAQDVVRTADEWWEEANTAERQSWLLSWLAQRMDKILFEVIRSWDENCDACAGKGFRVSSSASTGEEEASRCTLCNGAKYVRKVKWH